MPELPEVNLVVDHLGRLVTGREIQSSALFRERLAPHDTPERFASELSRVSIESVTRRGKFIVFTLSGGKFLLTHLRMSGRFALLPNEMPDPKFTHAVFYLNGDEKLVFQDQRHFGLMRVVGDGGYESLPEVAKLAPEPFSTDFSVKYLRAKMAASRLPIKQFLLDQTKVCGLGNIYAAESLYHSRINPELVANAVSTRKISQLHQAIISVLETAINHASRVEVDASNIGGNFYGDDADGDWMVYAREGVECGRCGKPIARIAQGGRSTYYCPRCQR